MKVSGTGDSHGSHQGPRESKTQVRVVDLGERRGGVALLVITGEGNPGLAWPAGGLLELEPLGVGALGEEVVLKHWR